MNLDDKKIYEKLDKHQVADSIDTLPDQIRQVMEDMHLVKIPAAFSKVNKVVLAGMGGSNLGIRILRHAFADQIKVPINIVAGYHVPKYVDNNTLYIISSYSGTTEEPLSTYKEARKRGAKIVAITNNEDSKLNKIMINDDVPGYIFDPRENPSGQPRMGLGYSVFGIALILDRAGIIKINKKEVQKLIDFLEINTRKLRSGSPMSRNKAKKNASLIKDKIPVLVGAEFLSGNLHVLRNQLNENSKSFATYLILPDANHFSMEGLEHPRVNGKSLVFVFFESELYSAKVKKRLTLTKEIVKKNGVEVVSLKMNGANKQIQCFEMLQVGTWLSFYLGIAYGVDPSLIPWVDWFKEQLKGAR